MATTVLNVPDISCEHCQRTITNALAPLQGVRTVNVDIPTRHVRVDYDESIVDAQHIDAVAQSFAGIAQIDEDVVPVIERR